MKKIKIINLLIILSSMGVYMEWGTTSHSFLFQTLIELVHRLFTNPAQLIHPFIILPVVGILFLVAAIFKRTVSKTLIFLGIGCLSTLTLMVAFAGMLSVNWNMILSVVPFIVCSIIQIRQLRNVSANNGTTFARLQHKSEQRATGR